MHAEQQTNRFQVTGRLLVLGLLGLALWNPTLPGRVPPTQAIILIDDSLSMEQSFVTVAWSGIMRLLGNLPSGSHYTLIRFAAQPVLEIHESRTEDVPDDLQISRTLPLDPSATNIKAALELALEMTDPERLPFLVLVSDGGETMQQAEQVLLQARSGTIPVFALTPEQTTMTADARIDSIQLPEHIRIGENIPLGVTLSSSLDVNGRIQVHLNNELVEEQPVALESGRQHNILFSIDPESTGPQEIIVSLDAAGDRIASNNRRSAIVNVDGPVRIMYITKNTTGSAAVSSLVAGGWNPDVVEPGQFLRHFQKLTNISTLVLDDIAVSDMSDTAWNTLARSVRTRGTGLVVLGGPRSFGAGGYRESTLETLLPVTAESRDPLSHAAVLFVVDKSGSMDQGNGGYSRFAYARQAVLGTAGILLDGDLTGLLAFDSEPHTWLPLGVHAEPVQALDAAWEAQPAGGTRIKPALLAGLAQLKAVEADQRLLVIVTDGFVAAEDVTALPEEFNNAGIDVIALAVGKDPDLDLLHSLTDINNGVLHQVKDVATLPGLMNEAVGVRRSAYEAGIVSPLEVTPLPFLAEDQPVWPPLTGYMVTRERSRANVYLRSTRGDPLLATHHAGIGKVTVLPAGLGQWANSWHDWPLWGQLLGGLVEWNAAQGSNPNLHIMLDDKPGEYRIIIDVLTQEDDWESSADISLTLRDPFDRLTRITPESMAPGRYVATLPVRQAGRYRISVRAGRNSLQHEFLHSAETERDAGLAGKQRLQSWLNAGIIQHWQPGEEINLASVRRNPFPLQVPLLVLALIIYSSLLVAARFPVNFHRYWQNQD